MNLSIGIVGLPNVGKSTLFKHLTNNEVHIANYPFATIDPNVGVVEVPDIRLEELSTVCESEQKIPAAVEFYDIAGLVEGANKGEGLGNQFLHHIRETKAIVQVVRCFEDENVIHVQGTPNPVRDITTINTELILKDMDTVQSRLDRVTKEAHTGDKDKIKEQQIMQQVLDALQEEKLVSSLPKEVSAHPVVTQLNLLTAKKQMYLLNGVRAQMDPNFLAFLDSVNMPYIIADLSQEQVELQNLITTAYTILGLISFFTAGEKEARAWTIAEGESAPQAAGTIHTDFEKKFIRAEVIGAKELIESGGWKQARAKGLVRLEGKEYIVQDGDVMIIKHG
jgi:hypothetical protein